MRHTHGGIIRPRLINRITVARPRLGRADELKLEAIRTESRAPPGNTILPCGTPSGATARCGFKRSTTALASLAARGILRAKDRSGHRLLKNTRRHALLRLHRARLRPLAGRPVWADHARALRHGTAPLRNIAVVSLVETPAPDDRRACDDANAAPRAAVPPEPAVRQSARAIFTAALPDIEAAGLRVPRDLSIIVCSGTPRPPNLKRDFDFMRLDFAAIGRRAFEALQSLHEGKFTAKTTLIDAACRSSGTVLTAEPPRRPRNKCNTL